MKLIVYDGKTYTFDARSLLIAGSLDAHRFRVASEYGTCLELLARLQLLRDTIDDRYRQWRAKQAVELCKSDKKPSEAMVKAHTEAHEDFLLYRSDIAKANADVAFVESWLKALEIKSRMLAVRTHNDTAGEAIAGDMRIPGDDTAPPWASAAGSREPGSEMRALGRAARSRRENAVQAKREVTSGDDQ